MNIVIMVIGSRGDIQPFIKIGKILKDQHSHRVRIATHPAFKDFVEKDSGLEHFSIGGDPSELMAFMVKNPGLLPSWETVKDGEIGRRRDAMAQMFVGFWRACVDASDEERDTGSPFVADAIIANPPSFAHVHCAERLGCPLHIMFTFPYTPTARFPHPLANIKKSNVDESYTNFMSYPLVELMTWQGLGDLCNGFRVKTLGLDPVSTIWAPGQLYRLKVPYTYLWSPGLVPKPSDWGSEIDIAGFVFLDLASAFQPPEGLVKFLDSGPPPIYIGFGSIVVDDPAKFTSMIFEAIERTGVRAVVSKGWGGFGENTNIPDGVFMLGNTPHDWLFPKCQAVVHHGGAGTTAIGLKLSKPTFIVPFFGDQPFWGSMVQAAGAGKCVHHSELTTANFAEAIKFLVTDEARSNVDKIAKCISDDGDGASNAVNSFHLSLPIQGPKTMRCSILKDRVAAWQMQKSNLRLSALAAELLVEKGQMSYDQLQLWRQYPWSDFQGPGGPLMGASGALWTSFTEFGKGTAQGPINVSKDIQKRAKHERKKVRHLKRQRERRKAFEAQGGPTEKTALQPGEPIPSSILKSRQSIGPSDPSTSQEAEGKDAGGLSQQQTAEPRRVDTEISVLSADPSEHMVTEVAKDVAHGVKEPLETVAKFPMDLFVGLTNGFHNAPRLYGDDSVRRPVRIQGFQSGLRAGGSELFYGAYDAVTGVVTQPLRGAKKDGAFGFVTGIGKGLGGLVLKGCAGVTAPISYSMQGIYKEATKKRTPVNYIRQARREQGRLELCLLDEERRSKALEAAGEGWKVMSELWEKGQRMKRGELGPGGEALPENPAWAGGKYVAGLKGRYQFEREKRHWEQSGAFENVDESGRALQTRMAGQGLGPTIAEPGRQEKSISSGE